jgi:hypothetical protein
MSHSEMEKVRRRLRRQGFVTTLTGRGHWRVAHPLMRGVVFTSGSPSDRRSIKNLRAQIRRQFRSAAE